MRYEPSNQSVDGMLTAVINQYFNHLANVKFLILLDTKKNLHKGKLALGKIQRASEVIKFLTTDIVPEGIDFVVYLDKKMVDHCNMIDIIRVIRHELRHVFVTERGKLRLIPHDYEDFYSEVELNQDDPTWANRVSTTVSLMYEQEADNE